MKLTLGQAAKHLRCSKATLSRAIKEGRLSAEKRDDRSFAIDPAELARYAQAAEHRLLQGGVGNTAGTPEMMRSTTHQETPETPNETGWLRREIELLRDQIITFSAERERERNQMVDQIEDLRRRLDTEGEERRKLTALLTDQRPRRSWWRFWREQS